MALFPGALPAAGTAVSTDTLAVAGHTALHNTVDDEVRAIATKFGTGSSAPAANQVLRGTGAGTSAWGQVDLAGDTTGTLPIAQGGTGYTSLADIKTNILSLLHPVGSIYINATDATNPGTLLGFGVWIAFGQGRVPVGFNGSDGDFNTAEGTGGAKTHTLTVSEIPAHTHTIRKRTFNAVSANAGFAEGAETSNRDFQSGSTGGDGAHNNLQPYIVVYMWKRTA